MSPWEELVAAARVLVEDGIHLFFKQGSHFQNPLVRRELAVLESGTAADDEGVRKVVHDLRSSRELVARGIYSPVPIARGLEAGEALDDLLVRFRYEMIVVDENQEWLWQGRPVAAKLRKFFLEQLAYEPDIDVYYFEYRVNDDWWDKSYFDVLMTPMVARTLVDHGGEAVVALNNGEEDRLDLESLRLDERERLFARTLRNGEALFSDSLRFSILKSVSEDCQSVQIAGLRRPLHWPDDDLED
jgi:hypothetical protein